jgi:hypothetical protein
MQIPPAKAVLAIRSNSSQWAKEGGQRLAWQQGYGVSRDVEKKRGVELIPNSFLDEFLHG